jgi:hypothetical protein
LGIFGVFFLLAFGYDIRWCPAVSEHHKSIQPVLWGLAGCRCGKHLGKLKTICFSKISERTLGVSGGFFG